MLGNQSVLCGNRDERIDKEMLILGWTAVRDGIVVGRRASFKRGAQMAGCDVRALSPLARKQGQARPLWAFQPMVSTSHPITDAVITLFFAQIVESLSRARAGPRLAVPSAADNDDPHLDANPHTPDKVVTMCPCHSVSSEALLRGVLCCGS